MAEPSLVPKCVEIVGILWGERGEWRGRRRPVTETAALCSALPTTLRASVLLLNTLGRLRAPRKDNPAIATFDSNNRAAATLSVQWHQCTLKRLHCPVLQPQSMTLHP